MEYKGHREETTILDSDNAKLHDRAANSELKVEQLRKQNNALELKLKNWPLEQRVSEISAILFLTVKGTNDVRLPAWGAYSNTFAYMRLCDNAVTYSNEFNPPISSGFNNLESYELEPCEVGSGAHGYMLRFQSAWDWKAMEIASGIDFSTMTAGQAIGLIKGLRIDLKFLPHDADIAGGHAEIMVNENNPSTVKFFDIPPQKALGDAGAFGVWKDTKGFTLISTNWH